MPRLGEDLRCSMAKVLLMWLGKLLLDTRSSMQAVVCRELLVLHIRFVASRMMHIVLFSARENNLVVSSITCSQARGAHIPPAPTETISSKLRHLQYLLCCPL